MAVPQNPLFKVYHNSTKKQDLDRASFIAAYLVSALITICVMHSIRNASYLLITTLSLLLCI